MSLLDKLKSFAGMGEKDLSLEEIQTHVIAMRDDNPKAEDQLLKLIRRNITLKNDGTLIAIVRAIPFSFRDQSNNDEYKTAVEIARSAIRLKTMTILAHEEELNGLSMENIILNQGTREDVLSIIDMLKNRDEFQRYGIDFPTGAMFCGPPGVGKTELARLIAKENQGNFIQVKSSDIIHGVVGASEKAITKMFEDAQRHALGKGVCVMFIDEAENILRDRNQGHQHSNVAHFLGQVDGFQKNRGVFIILSTNIPDDIDSAVLSRMSQKIEFQLPNLEQIQKIFKIHLLSKISTGDIQNKVHEFIDQNSTELSEVYKIIFDRKGSGRDIKNIGNAAKIKFMLRHIQDASLSMQISDIQESLNTVLASKAQ